MADSASPSRPRRTPRWRYVVPNAITLAGLLIGLTSCFRSMSGEYIEAAWLIVLCVLIDKLDGTAARLLRATSDIGLQLDSFADFVTFGIAPGTLVFMAMAYPERAFDGSLPPEAFALWGDEVSKWVMRTFVASYVLFATIRLAKFNVLPDDPGGPKAFFGVPTTLCGGFTAAVFLLTWKYEAWDVMRWMPVMSFVLGLLMISNLPLPKLAKQNSQVLNALMVVCVATGYICGLFRIYPETLLALIGTYLIWGLPWGLVHREELGLGKRRLDPYPDG